jgi:hypothetical protein
MCDDEETSTQRHNRLVVRDGWIPPRPSFNSFALNNILNEIDAEVVRAKNKHPRHAASAHEQHSVIREELEELWDHVKQDTGSSPEARKEAIQVAAMAVRYVLEICK